MDRCGGICGLGSGIQLAENTVGNSEWVILW